MLAKNSQSTLHKRKGARELEVCPYNENQSSNNPSGERKESASEGRGAGKKVLIYYQSSRSRKKNIRKPKWNLSIASKEQP